MASGTEHTLTLDTINPHLKIVKYALRGPIPIRAAEIEKELKKGVEKPFKEVIKLNIGDGQAMGQRPITFIRQILALVTYPRLLNNDHFPKDTKERARAVLEACKGRSIGSYSESVGIEVIRKQVALYIKERDGGIACDWNNIVLCSGACDGIRNIIKLMKCEVDGKKPGIMIPVPQFPLYAALLTEFDIERIDYYLDETNNWALDISELQEVIDEARKVCHPRALVVMNPGNPTGQVLPRENIEDIIKFAYKEKLFIIADEVYQLNVYGEGSKFFSFKKVMMELGAPYSKMELASFMSCSKGYMGECGLRGGYSEIVNFNPEAKAVYLKSISTKLSPTGLGQTCMYAVVHPPKKGEPSFDEFMTEKNALDEEFKLKAKITELKLNAIEGIKCNPVQGAIYAFPQIILPQKFIEAAKNKGKVPDAIYSMELLENTGICVIPGSGFGQAPGTYHFRMTILAPTEKLKQVLDKIKKFHEDLYEKYN
ncbi:Aminotran 1 2 domain containing protein [Asbolus verrucosus]|uniref:alanine transaminase n=1 Tax=Asbolus verrucosus TaxID=1661398 RepID=A0A482WDF9_ASBVE|nr:Aminotran 1 2 domain containing protein [Asbolus verrucosus]